MDYPLRLADSFLAVAREDVRTGKKSKTRRGVQSHRCDWGTTGVGKQDLLFAPLCTFSQFDFRLGATQFFFARS